MARHQINHEETYPQPQPEDQASRNLRFQQYVEQHRLHGDTVRVLAAHGHLDAGFLQIFDFPAGTASEESSNADSEWDNGDGTWMVFSNH